MKEINLYSAAPLFNAGQRAHNSRLEKTLKEEALKEEILLNITLPQRTALNRFISNEKGFDVNGIVLDCMNDSANHDVVLCNLDGPDADSGTAVEYGIALGQRIAYGKVDFIEEKIKVPLIITYRTDFRTSPEKEVGVNAMLKAKGTEYIYYPCFIVESEQFDEFYKGLSKEIIKVIKNNLG